MKPVPLGNAVTIPRNEVLKLKGTVDDLIGKDGTVRNVYWVTPIDEERQKILWIVNALVQDTEGNWVYSYYDEVGKLHRAKGKSPIGYFKHIPAAKRNDRMVMAHGGCKHQRFVPPGTPDAKIPDCGKFLIISPSGYRNLPDWLWNDTSREYSSIAELESEADQRRTKIAQLVNAAKTRPFGLAK